MPVQLLFGETQSDPDGPVLTITIPGYVPCNRNQLNGSHWVLVRKEKKRAGMLLLAALRSCTMSIAGIPAIGTDTILKLCKIFSSRLASYRTTDGKYFLAGSCPAKLQRKGKKGPKSKSVPAAKLPF